MAGGLLDIEISSASISPSVKRIDVTVDVAGKRIVQQFTNLQPNMNVPFAWNGEDGYGRRVYGTQRAKVTVNHVYDAVYYSPSTYWRSFGLAGQSAISASRARSEVMLGQTFDTELTLNPPTAAGLGGWTLNVQHVYDPLARILTRGDGGEEEREFSALTPTTVAGGGQTPPTTAGTPARQAQLNFHHESLAQAPNGSIVLAALERFYRLDADGLVRRLPDLTAPFAWLGGRQIVIDRQNRLLVGVPANVDEGGGGCSEGGHAEGVSVWMLDAANSWSEVTTTTTPEEIDGCGHPLVAVGADDTIYVTQGPYLYQFRPGDTAPVLIAEVGSLSIDGGISGITVGADGSVYVGSPGFIDKIDPSGRRTRVAGTGTTGYTGDDGPATAAQLSTPMSLQIDAEGTLYLLDQSFMSGTFESVRRITPQGIISTVAGGGLPNGSVNHQDGVPILGVTIDFSGIALGPDGKISALDVGSGYKLRTLGADSTPASISPTAIRVVSSDGSEVHVFDHGRHVQTRQTLTGIVLRTFEYNTENRLIGIVDRHGNRTTIERDGNGTPLRIIAPFGQQTTLTLDQDGMLSAVTDPANKATQLTYQAGGLLTSFTTPESNTSTFTYDGQGKLVSDQDPGGGVQTLTRTSLPDGWSVSLGHNAGYAREWITERPETGEEVTRTIAPGVSTPMVSTTYPDGRLDIVHPHGMHVTLERAPDPRFRGQVSFKKQLTTSTPSGLTATTTRTRTVVLADPDDPLSVQTFTIAATSNGRTRTNLYNAAARTLTSTSPLGRQIITTFNTAGLPVRFERPGQHPVIRSYNTLGQVAGITMGTRTSTLTYDSGGRLASVSNPHGGSTTYGYDDVGRLTSMAMPGARTVTFSFDDDGKMLSVAPPGRPAYAATFTPVGLLASFTAPGGGAGTVTTYRVDKRPETITRPGESPITIGYDAAGRVQQVVTSAGTVSTAYDASTGLTSGVTSPDAELAFAYDGVLPLETEWSGTVSGTVSWAWNHDFQVTSQSVNGANAVSFGYDLDGLITSAGALTLTRHAQTGFVTGTTIGSLTDTITPDSYGEVQSYSTTNGATPLAAFSYVRDDAGRIAQSTEVIDSVSHTFVYGYDPAGRLHQVTRDGTPIATYEYDLNGNRHTTTTSSGPISATFDNQDRLVTAAGATYTYTGSGNLQTRTETGGTTSYVYDALGNLRSVTLPSGQVVSYLVDGMQRRIARLVDGARTHAWLYEGKLHPVAELNASNVVTTRYVYSTLRNAPEYMIRGGSTYRLITDVRGSVRLVVNINTGAIAQRLDYDAWGDVTADSSPGFQPFGFAGGLYDHHTRLHRFGVRDYDGATGRWLAIDPNSFTGGSNLYAYAHGDPINFVDPAGDVPLLFPLVGALFGMGANIMYQMGEGKSLGCMDLSDVLLAGAFGALGAAIPTAGIGASVGWGAGLNVAQYNLASAFNGEMWTWQGLAFNAATGAAGGLTSGMADEMIDAGRKRALQELRVQTEAELALERFIEHSHDASAAQQSNMPTPEKWRNCPAEEASCP